MRDTRYDFYKGILIFGVIFGHMCTTLRAGVSVSGPILLYRFIRTYDMPMFAYITGVFLKKSIDKRGFSENVLNKIGTILLPVILWNLIFNVLSGNIGIGVSRFWFLWSIFFSACIVIVLAAAFRFNKYIKLIAMAGAVVVFHTVINDRWNIGFLLFPCIVGYYNDSIAAVFTRIKIPGFYKKSAVILLFIVMECFWTTKYNVWNTGCNIFAEGDIAATSLHIIYRGIIGITGCFVMRIVFDGLHSTLKNSRYKELCGINNAIVSIGQKTMQIYILQTFLV